MLMTHNYCFEEFMGSRHFSGSQWPPPFSPLNIIVYSAHLSFCCTVICFSLHTYIPYTHAHRHSVIPTTLIPKVNSVFTCRPYYDLCTNWKPCTLEGTSRFVQLRGFHGNLKWWNRFESEIFINKEANGTEACWGAGLWYIITSKSD